MDAPALRQAITAFLGADQFRKLVVQVHRAGRLRYWHEEEVSRFRAAHPDLRFTTADLFVVLRVCELHGSELQPDTAEVIEGNIDYADWYIKARTRLFPNARSGPVYTEGAPAPSRIDSVWYCPECRSAASAWCNRR
jgi:hypothetical protein